ncbi:hypothetical protein CABS01_17172 [Colletotrichum abscissum]|uniref:uncharacterized protein n=1 Tax=Colletotrichum abscissum TaxID=1671311 RepID=UPI0027D645F4|nr:uncharacterized protein CABS01_17172 [Colletotrichum abscissum]KAK1487162.1 hypothetical protein CABS01_17172 [Colletotrichum abscissum]
MASHDSQDSQGYHITDCLQATLTSLEEETERHRQNILISLQSQYIALLEERLDFEESTGPLIEVSGIRNGTNDDDKIRT